VVDLFIVQHYARHSASGKENVEEAANKIRLGRRLCPAAEIETLFQPAHYLLVATALFSSLVQTDNSSKRPVPLPDFYSHCNAKWHSTKVANHLSDMAPKYEDGGGCSIATRRCTERRHAVQWRSWPECATDSPPPTEPVGTSQTDTPYHVYSSGIFQSS